MKKGKRIFDLFLSFIGLTILFPVLLLICILVKIEDGGPVFFTQERVGYKGGLFKIYKFRTMRKNSDRGGRLITIAGDPRITRIGYWLRKFKLDELPQLFNVLRGEMSLVGPRPEVPKYVSLYTKEHERALDHVPGITDPASIVFNEESEILSQYEDPGKAYIERIMPEKIKLYLEYGEKATLISDILIMINTIKTLFFNQRHKG